MLELSYTPPGFIKAHVFVHKLTLSCQNYDVAVEKDAKKSGYYSNKKSPPHWRRLSASVSSQRFLPKWLPWVILQQSRVKSFKHRTLIVLNHLSMVIITKSLGREFPAWLAQYCPWEGMLPERRVFFPVFVLWWISII